MRLFFVFVLVAQVVFAQPGKRAKELKQGSQVTQSQKDALKKDLNAMVTSATRPDAALVNQLASDLSAALADGKVTGVEKAKLTKDLEKVMNSAGISAAQVSLAISDAQAILLASGVSKADVQKVVADLKAVAKK